MQTVIKSSTQSVTIGPDEPFVINGERINPTGRKKLAAEMLDGDLSRVERDARAQVEAGAHILDINVGVTSVEPEKTEPDLMIRAIELVNTGLCLDHLNNSRGVHVGLIDKTDSPAFFTKLDLLDAQRSGFELERCQPKQRLGGLR